MRGVIPGVDRQRQDVSCLVWLAHACLNAIPSDAFASLVQAGQRAEDLALLVTVLAILAFIGSNRLVAWKARRASV